jgi:hypothetical protein
MHLHTSRIVVFQKIEQKRQQINGTIPFSDLADPSPINTPQLPRVEEETLSYWPPFTPPQNPARRPIQRPFERLEARTGLED